MALRSTAAPTTVGTARLRETAKPRPGAPDGRSLLRKALFLGLLIFFTVLFVYPFIWLLSASLKSATTVFDGSLIPTPIHADNYSKLIDQAPVLTWAWNSVAVTLLAATTVTLSSSLVAFAFAYFRFPGRNILFGVVLATLLLPGAVTMIPTFLIWDALGFNNSLVPLWAGNLFGSAFYIFLLRQFFLTLPRDLFDAARVDGAGHLRIWWSVAMPLTRAALIVVFVFELKAAWTDLLKPLIFVRDVAFFTLPRGLKAIIDNPSIGGEKHYELLAVGGVIVTIPMLVVFFIAQRHFLDGIATTGSKG